MAKIDFAKTGAPATPVADTAPTTANVPVATPQASQLPAVPYSDDNISLKDIILPRINIVQKVGDLSNVFDGGTILLNGELELYNCPKDAKAPAPTPLNILVLGFQPIRYAEKVEGGGRGIIYNTPAEVVAGGGTIDYNEAKATGKPLYQELASALILLEKPDNIDDANFPHEFGGKKYCTALWSMKGSGFTHGAKVFRTARKIGKLRDDSKGGYRSAFYTFGTKLTSYNGQFYYIPVLKPSVETTEEFRNWIKNEVVGF